MQLPGALRMVGRARCAPFVAVLAVLAAAVIAASPALAQCPNSGSNCTVTSGSLPITTIDSYPGTTNVSSGATLEITGTGALNGGSTITNAGTFQIDNGGTGTFTSQTLTTTGTLTVQGTLNIGSLDPNAGSVTVSNGGTVTATGFLSMGNVSGASSLTVTGAGSSYTSDQNTILGGVSGATASITISNGASFTGTDDDIGAAAGSTATITVTGAGTTFTDYYQQLVGDNGTGTLIVSNGAAVTVEAGNYNGSYPVYIGGNAPLSGGGNGTGTVIVTGAGSTYTVAYYPLYLGYSGMGTLTVANGGNVTIDSGGTGTIYVANQPGSTGTINIGAAAGQTPVGPGTISASTISFGGGTGSIVFNHTSSDYTFNPVITGAGSVVVDAGTTIFPGANTYSGATIINGGALEVDGSIADTSSVTVNSGGTLSGTGTVDPPTTTTTIMSGGTLAPGNAANPTGMLTIAGSLMFQSAALYLVTVSGANASTTFVTSTATLGGTVQVAFASAPTAKSYDILQSTGLGGTTFSGVIAPNYKATLSYSTTDVFLNITGAALGNTSALNRNEQNVAATINTFSNSGGTLPASFANLFNLTGGNLTNALTQLDGEVATGAEQSAFQLTTEFLNLMLDPFVNGRGNLGGAGGGNGPGLGFAPDQQASLPPDIALAYAEVLKAPPANFDRRWGAWGAAYGGANNTEGNATVGSHDVSAQAYGYAAGMDYHFAPYGVAGFALAGGGTAWGLANALGSGYSQAFQFGGYGIERFGPAYLAAALSFTNNWFTTNRSALGDELRANFAGQSYGARVEGGYRCAVLPMLGVTPYAAAQFQDFSTTNYSESDLTGGGLGLSYAAMNATDVRTELGARFDDPTLLYGKPLILFGRLAWAHDFVSNPSLSAAFEALPGSSFTVFGAPIPHDSALTTAGLQYFITANWQVIAKFDGDFAEGYQTYAGTGTLRYTW